MEPYEAEYDAHTAALGGPDEWDLAEMRDAISAVLFENPRELDIRWLWTRAGCHCFRVNRWTERSGNEPFIRRSVFLRVLRTAGGYRVYDQTARAA